MICKKCKINKDPSEYYPRNLVCKDCYRERVRNLKFTHGVKRTCTECGAEFMTTANEIKRRGGGGYTCSRKCHYKRLPKILEIKFSGMKMTYASVHCWVKNNAGKADHCEGCGTTEAVLYDWSNISGEYRRDLSDWKQLCRKCHIDFDIKHHGKSEKFKASQKRRLESSNND